MDIFSLLRTANSKRASDLHMVAGSPAIFRIDGSLESANGVVLLSAEDINEAFLQITTPEERETFHRHLELDFGYTLPDVGRLRCNAAQQRGAISLAVRLLPPKIPHHASLRGPSNALSAHIQAQTGAVGPMTVQASRIAVLTCYQPISRPFR